MTRLSIVKREEKKSLCVEKSKNKRKALKSICTSSSSSPAERQKARRQIEIMARNTSPVRLRNRCSITGKGRSVYRQFGLGRSKLREMVMSGVVPGVIKASW